MPETDRETRLGSDVELNLKSVLFVKLKDRGRQDCSLGKGGCCPGTHMVEEGADSCELSSDAPPPPQHGL